MGRLFVTGDTHMPIDIYKLSEEASILPNSLTREDIVVVCGDFGLVWNYRGEDEDERFWREWLEERPYTICFVDGNHENFDRLNNDFPVIEWNGGRVHQICENVFHLMRGEVYTVNGKRWFAFGGAESTDRAWRVERQSWWRQETPSLDEYNNGVRQLRANNFEVDYVFTHAIPYCLKDGVYVRDIVPNPTTEFMLQDFYRMIEFKYWFCGHYHMDVMLDSSVRICYNSIVEIVDDKLYKITSTDRWQL